ncbi:transposase InsO family protein [Rhizobium sp. SLBN-94]|nr:transposase InsO family protein [Rhizobium sp. SLBN-94]
MLDAAIGTVTDGKERPIIHSDRGVHYRWPGWLTRISEANLIRSMSRKGCSQDNAACEGFFGRLKTELFPRDWKAITIEQFVEEVDAYIRWFNEKRIKIAGITQPGRVSSEPRPELMKQSNFLSAPPPGHVWMPPFIQAVLRAVLNV